MDGEGVPAEASLKQALYWRQIYTEILAMEKKVLDRIYQLMAKQSEAARREVELTNVPVVVAQAEKFRQRLGTGRRGSNSSTGSLRDASSVHVRGGLAD